VLANPTSTPAWKKKDCIWEREGVWRWSEQRKEGIALQDDYFSKNQNGDKIDFYRDCYFPLVEKWNKRIGGKKMKMVAPIPNEFCPTWPRSSRPDNFVYAPHWYIQHPCSRDSELTIRYDLNALFKKQFGTLSINVQGLSRVSPSSAALAYG
jgi:hypothetical protein